jgi:tetratricopeptide (TPR) repeat protein
MDEGRPREIRVFVSSTFLDMQGERDQLVKQVFPALRRACEAKGVALTEVDLRWGITNEQKELGAVLPLCLELVDQCHPYFIGLLGERYGWVPEDLSGLEERGHAWVGSRSGRSATELEIEYAALRHPTPLPGAYFYFRDPAFAESLPQPERWRYEEGSATAREALAALKQRIRDSGAPVREPYRDPAELGRLVAADFTVLLERLFPADAAPMFDDAEQRLQAVFAERLAQDVLGRNAELDQIDAVLDHPGGAMVIVGEPGAGKSALLAGWAARRRAARPAELVLEHHIGATENGASSHAVTRALLVALDHASDLAASPPADSGELRLAFATTLRAAAADRVVVLAIDALERLEDDLEGSELDWLPDDLPPSVRLLFAVEPGSSHAEIARRRWPVMVLAPLPEEVRAELLTRNLSRHAKALDTDRTQRIAHAPAAGNPLFLTTLADELRLWGDHDTLDERIGYFLGAKDVDDLYQRVLARYEADYEEGRPGLVGEALTCLWASLAGLSEAELRDLLGQDGEPLAHLSWAVLRNAAAGALVSRDGLVDLGSQALRRAVESRYLADEAARRAAHVRIADHFRDRPAGPRRTVELPWQLAQAADWRALNLLLSDLRFLADAWALAGERVRLSWAAIEHGSAYRLADAYRPVVRRPAAYLGPERGLTALGELLAAAGETGAALSVAQHLAAAARARRSPEELFHALRRLGAVHMSRGEYDLAEAQHLACEALLDKVASPSARAALFGDRAVALTKRGEPRQAAALYEQQQELLERLGDYGELARARTNQAVMLRRTGDNAGAQILHEQAAAVSRATGDRAARGLLLGNQAVALLAQGRLDEAEDLLREQERIARSLNDRASLQLCLGNLAGIAVRRGRHGEVERLSEERERLCREIGDRPGLCAALGDRGVAATALGKTDAALALHVEEEGLCREMDLPADLQRSLHNQAVIHIGRGSLPRAMTLSQEQERVCRAAALKDGLQQALALQGLIHRLGGRLAAARSLALERERLCLELGDRVALQDTLGQQAVILLTEDAPENLPLAETLLLEQEAICRELDLRGGLQQVLGNRASLETRRGRSEKALALHAEEEGLCRALGLKDALQTSLGNQANILAGQRRFAEAAARFDEQIRLCREIGAVQGLVAALTNQAMMIAEDLQRPADALPLIEEACGLCDRPGLEQLLSQIEPARDYIRTIAAS